MTPRPRALLATLAVAALTLTACGGSSHTASVTPSAVPTVTTTAAATSAAPSATPSASASATAAATSAAPTSSPTTSGYVAPALSWHACADGFQCSTLIVPVDYTKPTGPTFALAVARLPAADPSQRIGDMFVNPGGPGGSGVQFLEGSASVFSQAVRNRFDLVTFDPRGVGASDGVRCATNSQLDTYLDDNPDPATPALRATYDSATKAFVAGCEKMSGSELAHVGTADVARDINTFRAALGQKTLTYFGFSYGTYLGTVLLAEFPKTVRVAILDGAVDPGQDLVGFVSGQGKSFDASLARFFAWCQSDASCDFHSDPSGGDASVTARWDALAAQVAKTPLKVGSRVVDSAEFETGTAYAMYSRGLWTDLGTALAAMEQGSGADMLSLADSYNSRSSSGSYDDSLDANTAVNCLDHTGPATTAGYYSAAQAVRATAPRLGPGIVYQQSSCAYWPIKASPPPTTVAAGGPPTVVVGGLHDPATPYVWAQALAKDIPGSVLVTHDGDGHTAYGPDNPCIQNLVDKTLLTLALPASGQTCSS